MNKLRDLPSVESILQIHEVEKIITQFGRPLTTQAIRKVLTELRSEILENGLSPSLSIIISRTQNQLLEWTAPTLIPVINATGVILHTNLGRAPLSHASILAIQNVAQGYSNLEYDLEKGKRGSRTVHAESLFCHLTGCEAALVVNNNASAVLLILTALAKRKTVVIARSQLVEIGDGFRMPDVMKQSGAHLIEVGATNRVHLSDYEQTLPEKPAIFLRAHRSNFALIGFTSEPELKEIGTLAHRSGIPFIDDLGSGSLLATEKYGLGHEPTIQESLQAGVDLVCFSGDKLLGGPQAGIIIGKRDLIDKLKKHPLARAVRADKLVLAGISATLLHYLKNEAETEIPVWRMISMSLEQITQRAKAWQSNLGWGEVIPGLSTIGGGSLPGETLPTMLLTADGSNQQVVMKKLRSGIPPIIARIQDNRIIFDPRTVLIEQEDDFLRCVKKAMESNI